MNKTTTTALPIHITPHHLRLSPALCDFVHTKLAKVPRFATDVLATDIVLRRHHGTADGKLFSASARLALAGRDIHASASHADLYTAIVKLVGLLARRSRKRKTRLANIHAKRRTNASRNPFRPSCQSNATNIAEPESAPDPMRLPRRRDGGQEQRVFTFRRTAASAFHPI